MMIARRAGLGVLGALGAAMAVLFLVAFWSTAFAQEIGPHDLPNPQLTPGAVAVGITREDVCVPGYSKGARAVPEATKRQVLRAYGVPANHQGICEVDGGCEIDHLISLELGGSNDPANLWPQPYAGSPWNAHVKDQLENRLHAMVCAGQIGLGDAQAAMASNWIAAYQRWISPTPLAKLPKMSKKNR
jgi:hypothetical protein